MRSSQGRNTANFGEDLDLERTNCAIHSSNPCSAPNMKHLRYGFNLPISWGYMDYAGHAIAPGNYPPSGQQ
ncbi:hypothetical protein N7495_002252 [Penicillium taxi]|uniref:uncharacterized protein n=1 Tax=Penicillium taxi TaxID=168475 RepID=UPI002544DA6F|nr:uncharacterized protein N7495_002252 [Penicillium taxi]KAJ5901724.1 hypothetical protein N7495_002252 [Penicillium taxi]